MEIFTSSLFLLCCSLLTILFVSFATNSNSGFIIVMISSTGSLKKKEEAEKANNGNSSRTTREIFCFTVESEREKEETNGEIFFRCLKWAKEIVTKNGAESLPPSFSPSTTETEQELKYYNIIIRKEWKTCLWFVCS